MRGPRRELQSAVGEPSILEGEKPASLTPAFPHPSSTASSLRVVMVVANDVTRDSRVLREASVLAAAGHRVTVLGIRTARTHAPDTELRGGFVIRRLPYRARPPGWWVPPDFYGRIRYRAQRQYRIHRAKAGAFIRLRRKNLRGLGPKPGAWMPLHLPSVAVLVRRQRRLVARIRSLPRHMISRVSAALSSGIWHSTDLVDRASRRVLTATPGKLGAWARRLFEAIIMQGATFVRLRRGEGTGSVAESRLRSRPAPMGGLEPLRVGVRLRIASMAVRHFLRAAGHAAQAWGAIATLLAWGSLYLLANRACGGAIEWATGWRWRWYGWAEYLSQHAPDADVWHGHDMTSLPAIVELKRRRGGLAVYDSHEVYLESGRHAGQPRWAKAPLERLERSLVAEVDAVITVNQSLATILSARLQRHDIHVLYNCPTPASKASGPSILRRTLRLRPTVPLLLYHGSLAPDRGVEQLLAAIQRPELADAHLAFLGFGSLLEWLRQEAASTKFGGRVHVLDAVDPDELPAWLVGVDVAVAPIQASTVNHRYSSPNKVFEAIAAGTPVAGSDLPEFRRVIADPEHGPLGVLFDPSRPDAIARAVREILDLPPTERSALRRRCRRASEIRWNWWTESAALVRLYGGFTIPEAQTDLYARGA